MYIVECWIEHPVLKLDQCFSYTFDHEIPVGARVEVEFNNRSLIGFSEQCTYTDETIEEINERLGFKTKPIKKVIDQQSLITPDLHDLALWMAEDTISPTISCFQAMLPSKIKPATNAQHVIQERWVKLSDNEVSLTPKQLLAVQTLQEAGQMKYSAFREQFKSIAKTLVDKGAIIEFTQEKTATKTDDYPRFEPLKLNDEQEKAMQQIEQSDKDVILVHGVTGSGKTELYLQLAAKIIASGKQVLILVPEIGLTPQMVQRVKGRFGKDVAIYHSGLNPQEKYEQYQLVRNNEVSVVVGTRSAVFMPFNNLGLIVIDEEHDTSYKQDSSPQYHAKDVAIYRAKHFGCKVILGSATPSLETYARAATKHLYELVELKDRINHTLPIIKLIDLKKAIKQHESYIIGDELKQAMISTLEKKQQVILLLNRRGYSSVLRCKSCQEVLMCPHCDLALSYHQSENVMKCHTCGSVFPLPKACPSCKSTKGFMPYGYGTQRVEEELHKLFPNNSVIRMDADTTKKKNSHEIILKKFENHEADILLGTQMIAKGLDYPDVTLVGILNGDAQLNFPDYRSGELTFDLLMQASGRSGRSVEQGKVFIQVWEPDNYVLQSVLQQSYEAFYKHEMQYRHRGNYPPYSYIVSITCSDRNNDRAREGANTIKTMLNGNFTVLGVSELLKTYDTYHYRLILKGKDLQALKSSTRSAVYTYLKQKGSVKVGVDVNPVVLD